MFIFLRSLHGAKAESTAFLQQHAVGRRIIQRAQVASKHSWMRLREFAQAEGMAICTELCSASLTVSGNYRPGRGVYRRAEEDASAVEKPLREVCELSGGFCDEIGDSTALSKSLERFVTMWSGTIHRRISKAR